MAICWLKAERFDEAVDEYQHGVTLLEERLSGDDVDAARKDIGHATRVWADNQERLICLLECSERHEEAQEEFRRASATIEPLFQTKSSRLIALEMSLPLLGSIAGETTGQPARMKLQQLVDQHLESGLESARAAVLQDSDSDEAWQTWSQLAYARYGTVNWRGAEDEARRAIELAPKNPNSLLGMAPLLLLAGETEEYRELCVRLLAASAAQKPFNDDANWTVRLCGLAPSAAGAADRALALALTGATSPDRPFYYTYPVGRAYYRAGQYENAVETLKRALAKSTLDAEPLICLDLAIAHFKWGQEEEARDWLERARGKLKQGQLPKHMHEIAETTALRREAEQLLGPQDSQNE